MIFVFSKAITLFQDKTGFHYACEKGHFKMLLAKDDTEWYDREENYLICQDLVIQASSDVHSSRESEPRYSLGCLVLSDNTLSG